MTRESWEIFAGTARNIANSAPLRKLKETKEQICQEILEAAYMGKRETVIVLCYYELSCLEDWCNIFNWLKELGYIVEDYSGQKLNPRFIVKW